MAQRKTFDDSKDVVVRMLPGIDLGEGEAIELKICSYNGGPHKLNMSRKKEKHGEVYFSKLGRISPDELKLLAPCLAELAKDKTLWEEER